VSSDDFNATDKVQNGKMILFLKYNILNIRCSMAMIFGRAGNTPVHGAHALPPQGIIRLLPRACGKHYFRRGIRPVINDTASAGILSSRRRPVTVL
jgi:hypothetical protein